MVGIDYAEVIGAGPLWLEGGLRFVWDSASDSAGGTTRRVETEIFEASAGLGFSPSLGAVPLRPHVGAGLAIQFSEFKGRDVDLDEFVSDSDAAFGAYATVGLHLVLNGLMGLLLGWLAVPAILVALFLQALLFQFGGFVPRI